MPFFGIAASAGMARVHPGAKFSISNKIDRVNGTAKPCWHAAGMTEQYAKSFDKMTRFGL